jgi:hypothetical protein
MLMVFGQMVLFLKEQFVQLYPTLDVNNVPGRDIAGPTSYFWYTWSTDVKAERDRNMALKSPKRSNVNDWVFNAEVRLSESGAPRYDIASISSHESAASKKAMQLAKFLQTNCNQAKDGKQPILSEKETTSTLGQINGEPKIPVIVSAAAAPKPIRVGTDCSGMESPIQALEGMKMPFHHVFACDNDPNSKKSIEANWDPSTLYPDITTRDN